MELIEVIKNRISTRKFKKDSVEREKLELLIDAARLAPSAKNRQPWYFVILENEIKNKVADIMSNQLASQQDICGRVDEPTNPHNPAGSVKASIEIIKEAPVLILVFRNKDIEWKEGDYLSIGCAVEHLCLRATDIGLGSLWIRDVVYARSEISSFVNKVDMELVTAVSIGYSNEFPYERRKKKITEIMEWYCEDK